MIAELGLMLEHDCKTRNQTEAEKSCAKKKKAAESDLVYVRSCKPPSLKGLQQQLTFALCPHLEHSAGLFATALAGLLEPPQGQSLHIIYDFRKSKIDRRHRFCA